MLNNTVIAKLPQHHSCQLFLSPRTRPTFLPSFSSSPTTNFRHPSFLSFSHLSKKFKSLHHHRQNPDDENKVLKEKGSGGGSDIGWLPAFPHVLIASLSNFLFGYHIGVMNGPIISIAKELGFEGNSILEGLVVSIFIGGAFIGSIGSGFFVDKLGFRRTFQLATVPLILGALISAQADSLDDILCGRFLVGLGIGVNTVLVPVYISEVEDDA